MWMSRHTKKLLSGVMLIMFLLTGCGESQPDLNAEEVTQEEQQIDYFITEHPLQIELPDFFRVFEDEITDAYYWNEEATGISNGCLYRLLEQREAIDDSWFIWGYCLQLLPGAEGQVWNIPLSPYAWQENVAIHVEKVLAVQDTSAVLLLSGREDTWYVGVCDTEGRTELLGKAEGFSASALYIYEDEILRVITNQGTIMTTFSQDFQQEKKERLASPVLGYASTASGDKEYSCGYEENKFILYDGLGGKELATTTEIARDSQIRMCCLPDGSCVIANEQGVWKYDGELKCLFRFVRKGYILDALQGLMVGPEGELVFYVTLEGEDCLLKVTEGPYVESDAQEVVIALLNDSPVLEKMAARYNRRNEAYHISFLLPEDGEELADYRRRVQLEVSAGRGPDLLAEFILDTESAIEQGFFQSMDDVPVSREDFLSAALDYGMYEGKQYGIPYTAIMSIFVASQKLLGDADSWTVEEMMDVVKASDARILAAQCSSMDILLNFGLADEANTTYIDWEKGISHLEEDAFLELLEFAAAYGDKEDYVPGEVGEMLLKGEIIGKTIYASAANFMNYAEACFRGETSYIGIPNINGDKVYLSCGCFFLNSASQVSEGAKEFLRYLISQEGQRYYMKDCEWGILSIRREIIEESISYFRKEDGKERYRVNYDAHGIYWDYWGLDEEAEDCFWELLDCSFASNTRIYSVYSILEEELTPYFEGARSAREAAQIADSRVQLFLDELK